MSLPLEGVRVIELGQIYAVPYCTLQLAYLGAEVVKIEPPGQGEFLRHPRALAGDIGYAFLLLNANKKSVALNLKHPRGREILLSMLENADVLVENYLEGAMESLGLGYTELAPRFPRLIYASAKGYGRESRWARLGAMDSTVQAASGFISVTGFPETGVKTSATFIDMSTGSHLVSGILAALIERGRTGRGQQVEVAMLDVCIPALVSVVASALEGKPFKRRGNRHWGACPANVYPAADGEILVFCLTESHWRAVARAMGREDLIADPRFKDHGTRIRIADELDELVSQWTRPRRREELTRVLLEARVPCAPVRTVEEVVADPEVSRRKMLMDCEYPARGTIKVAGLPIKFTESSADNGAPRRPPLLGEHTAEVLHSVGVDAAELEKLRREGVV